MEKQFGDFKSVWFIKNEDKIVLSNKQGVITKQKTCFVNQSFQER